MQKIPLLIISFLIFSFASSRAEKVCIKDTCIDAKLAVSPQQRAEGLMRYKGLKENQGMLFIFATEERRSFWMKDMQFALDIIWISQDKKIVEIMAGLKPCARDCQSLIPSKRAQYALEVKAGFAQRHKIKVGDKVNF